MQARPVWSTAALFRAAARAFIRRFKLSRISFRELANAGMIPGVTKSSW